MLNTAFTLIILTALILLIGMIKPKWVLFWMKNPERIWVIVIAVIMFMISFTLYGEANKRLMEAQQAGAQQPAATQSAPAEPAPVSK